VSRAAQAEAAGGGGGTAAAGATRGGGGGLGPWRLRRLGLNGSPRANRAVPFPCRPLWFLGEPGAPVAGPAEDAVTPGAGDAGSPRVSRPPPRSPAAGPIADAECLALLLGSASVCSV
jgi:hypothetical protein